MDKLKKGNEKLPGEGRGRYRRREKNEAEEKRILLSEEVGSGTEDEKARATRKTPKDERQGDAKTRNAFRATRREF